MNQFNHEVSWKNGKLHVDEASRQGGSAIRFERPLTQAYESMPIGSGPVGVMISNVEGFTAQINRGEGLPDLLSCGHLVIPSLKRMTESESFNGALDLIRAALVFRTNKSKVTCRVLKGSGLFLIEGEGFKPGEEHLVEVRLWDHSRDWYFDLTANGTPITGGTPSIIPRYPTSHAAKDWMGMGEIYQAFSLRLGWYGFGRDPGLYEPRNGFSHAVRVDAREVSYERESNCLVRCRFKVKRDGTFKIFSVTEAITSKTKAPFLVAKRLAKHDVAKENLSKLTASHDRWWGDFNQRSFLWFQSRDQTGEYLSHLRMIYLYSLASSTHQSLPTGGGGTTGLFLFNKDYREWGTTQYHWNNRNLYFCTLAAGCEDLRAVYLDFYLDRIRFFQENAKKNKRKGLLIPEICFPSNTTESIDDGSFVCGILTNALEVSNELLATYEYHPDRDFLRRMEPFLKATVEFWLERLVVGSDGCLHVLNSTAGETFVHVNDPISALGGIRAVFPKIANLFSKNKKEAAFVSAIRECLERLAKYPIHREKGCWGDCEKESQAIAAGKMLNVENRCLDLVYPYGLKVREDLKEYQKMYLRRKFDTHWSWSTDAVVAATLGYGGSEGGEGVIPALSRLIEKHQKFPCGLGHFDPSKSGDGLKMISLEAPGLWAECSQLLALQCHGEVIEVFRGWPQGGHWEGAFQLLAPGGFRVTSEITSKGMVKYVAVESLRGGRLRIKNPWRKATVSIDGRSSDLFQTDGDEISFETKSGKTYLLENPKKRCEAYRFRPYRSRVTEKARRWGSATIGVEKRVTLQRKSLVIGDVYWGEQKRGRSLVVEIENSGGASLENVDIAIAGERSEGAVDLIGRSRIKRIRAGQKMKIEVSVDFQWRRLKREWIRVEIDPEQKIAFSSRLGLLKKKELSA